MSSIARDVILRARYFYVAHDATAERRINAMLWFAWLVGRARESNKAFMLDRGCLAAATHLPTPPESLVWHNTTFAFSEATSHWLRVFCYCIYAFQFRRSYYAAQRRYSLFSATHVEKRSRAQVNVRRLSTGALALQVARYELMLYLYATSFIYRIH